MKLYHIWLSQRMTNVYGMAWITHGYGRSRRGARTYLYDSLRGFGWKIRVIVPGRVWLGVYDGKEPAIFRAFPEGEEPR